MRKLGLILVLAVAGCAPRPAAMIQGDPTATAALLALPEAQFFAQMALAEQVGAACTSIAFNQSFSYALVAHRFGAGRRGLRAASNHRATELERDVAMRSLQARYDVTFDQGDLCAIGSGEIARKSALSAVLIPT